MIVRFSSSMKKVNSNNSCFTHNRRLYRNIAINNKSNSSNKWDKPKIISEQIKELRSKKSTSDYKENRIINKGFDFKQMKKDDTKNIFPELDLINRMKGR